MTIAVRQVAHVCILAKDLAETRAFYAEVLGLPVKFEFVREGKPHGFYLEAGGRTNIEVFEKAGVRYGRENGVDHLCLEVVSIDDAVAHVRGKGVEISDKKYGIDDTWQAWLADPNGVPIELFEYTDRSAQFVGGDRTADW